MGACLRAAGLVHQGLRMAEPARTTVVSLWDFFGAYPDEHPVGREMTRMVMVGYPAGRMERFSRKTVSACMAFGLTTLLCLAVLHLALLVAVAVGAALAAATGFLWFFARTSKGIPADAKVGVLLTNHRVVVARSVRGGIPVVLAEVPARSVRRARIALVPSFWSRRRPATGLTLGGEDGDLVTIEVPRARVDLLEERLRDAGISDVSRA